MEEGHPKTGGLGCPLLVVDRAALAVGRVLGLKMWVERNYRMGPSSSYDDQSGRS